ncbi:MAG: pilus assembly FimT family protein [Rubripirellula sp.]
MMFQASKAKFNTDIGIAAKRFQDRRMRSGVTLVELLLVLGLMLVLASLVTPNLVRFLESNQVKRQLRNLQSTLGKARCLAIENARTVVFEWQSGGEEFKVFALENPYEQTIQGMRTSKEAFILPESLSGSLQDEFRFVNPKRLPATQQEASRIFFFPDGSGSFAEVGIARGGGPTHWLDVDPLTGSVAKRELTR